MSKSDKPEFWFETPDGDPVRVPQGDRYPIVIGRIAPGDRHGEPYVGITQTEDSAHVSRRHAYIYRNLGGDWRVEDAGSTGGLFINGMEIEVEKSYPLLPGAVLRLCDYEITFNARSSQTNGGTAVAEPVAGRRGGDTESMPGHKAPAPEPFAPGPPAAESIEHTLIGDEPSNASNAFDFSEDEPFFLETRVGHRTVQIEAPADPRLNRWIAGRGPGGKEIGGSTGAIVIPNQLDFESVSRRHVELVRVDSKTWRVRNLSRNGSRVNGVSLKEDQQADLTSGGSIKMGVVIFTLRRGSPKNAPHSPLYPARKIKRRSGPSSDSQATQERREPGGVKRADGFRLPPWGRLIGSNPEAPERIVLNQSEISIGCHPVSADIRLEGPDLEPIHAIMRWGSSGLVLHSKGPKGSVFVNAESVGRRRKLAGGDFLGIGGYEFQLQLDGRPPISAEAQRWRRAQLLLAGAAVAVAATYVLMLFSAWMMAPAPNRETPAIAAWNADDIIALARDQGYAAAALIERQFNDPRGKQQRDDLLGLLHQAAGLRGELARTEAPVTGAQAKQLKERMEKLRGSLDIFRGDYREDLSQSEWFKKLDEQWAARLAGRS